MTASPTATRPKALVLRGPGTGFFLDEYAGDSARDRIDSADGSNSWWPVALPDSQAAE